MSLACPACGASLQFKSRFSAMSVCPYCQSILLRKNDLWQQQGTMAVLPPDMSPFQIGTTGKYARQTFEIIGQLKIAWQAGSWNEWYLAENNGNAAWLAEAMGFLSYTREMPLSETLDDPLYFTAGQTLQLAGLDYTISDIKSFECVGCMGELPFEFTTGMQGTSIDLVTTANHCAYLEYVQGVYRFFKGKNVAFDDLELNNLRALDGW